MGSFLCLMVLVPAMRTVVDAEESEYRVVGGLAWTGFAEYEVVEAAVYGAYHAFLA